jgi:hypothetical protein
MKNIITISALAVAFIIAFVISFNWSNSFDYSDIYQSMAPLAVTWILGVFAIGTLGGVVGAIWEYNEAN